MKDDSMRRAEERTLQINDGFPVSLFMVYVLYYAGQAVYNTYLNLYLDQIGFSASQIGIIISVSTVALLATQTFWGMLSDRMPVKNYVVSFLCLAAAVCAVSFYFTRNYWAVLLLVTAFSIFYVPMVPLKDNITLEYLMTSRWDYGWIRMGGTIGYAFMAVAAGYILKDQYASIFMLIAGSLVLFFLFFQKVPKVRGYGGQKKHPHLFREVLTQNRTLPGLIAFYLIYSLGISLFNNFYSLHFVDIGGNSQLVGWMMFMSSVAEVPCLMFMHRIVRRLGTARVLTLAGAVTCLRWSLLYVLTDPVLIIFANVLQGFGFSSFNYCLLNYINNRMPAELRASSQVLNTTLSMIFSKLIFGYVGGLAFDLLGASSMMLCSAVTMGTATAVFWCWSRKRQADLSF